MYTSTNTFPTAFAHSNKSSACCKHVMTFKGLCCECGVDTTVVYTKQNLINLDWALGFCPNECKGLRVSSVKAVQDLFIQDNKSLIQSGKLRIVLDLDETLIHTIRTLLPKPTPQTSTFSYHHHQQQQFHHHSVAFNAVTYDTIDEQHDTPMDVEEDLASMLEAHLESVQQEPVVPDATPKGIDFAQEAEYVSFVMGNAHYKVYIRPGLRSYLQTISKMYDVYIYTHGTDKYARRVLEHVLHEDLDIIKGIFARQSATCKRSLKQLHKMLCKRSVSIIVDDRTDVWCKEDKQNVVQITPFKGSSTDRALADLAIFLSQVHQFYFSRQQMQKSVVDVRVVLQYFAQDDLQQLLNVDVDDCDLEDAIQC